jgi:hypothetical protein
MYEEKVYWKKQTEIDNLSRYWLDMKIFRFFFSILDVLD